MKKQFFANFPKIAQQYGRTLLLILAIIAGVSIPQAAVFSGSIQYLVFGMMFLSFVGLKFERSALRFSLLNVLVANILVALVAFYVLRPVDDNLALVGFMTGISPTAISAPVVIALLERRVDYVVAAVLLTNLSMALIVPFLLPWLGGNQVHVSIWEVLQSVAVVVILPLICPHGHVDPRLTLILFNLDETTYARELAPLAGVYPAIKLGPPWWFHDSLNGMRRYFDRVVETAGIYNTAGFNDDTRAYPSIPARHDVWRRAACDWVAGLLVRHLIDEDDAHQMARSLAYDLAKDAYHL